MYWQTYPEQDDATMEQMVVDAMAAADSYFATIDAILTPPIQAHQGRLARFLAALRRVLP